MASVVVGGSQHWCVGALVRWCVGAVAVAFALLSLMRCCVAALLLWVVVVVAVVVIVALGIDVDGYASRSLCG